jgi:hypothetical protein
VVSDDGAARTTSFLFLEFILTLLDKDTSFVHVDWLQKGMELGK